MCMSPISEHSLGLQIFNIIYILWPFPVFPYILGAESYTSLGFSHLVITILGIMEHLVCAECLTGRVCVCVIKWIRYPICPQNIIRLIWSSTHSFIHKKSLLSASFVVGIVQNTEDSKKCETCSLMLGYRVNLVRNTDKETFVIIIVSALIWINSRCLGRTKEQ